MLFEFIGIFFKDKLLKSIQQKQLKQFKSKRDNFYTVIKKSYYGIIED